MSGNTKPKLVKGQDCIFLEWPNKRRSWMPDEQTANNLAAAPELLAYAECEQAHRESLLPSDKGGTGNGQSYFETFNKHGWNGRDVYGFLDGLRRAAIAKATGTGA